MPRADEFTLAHERMTALLAFDSATEALAIALRVGERVLVHEGAGGAQASVALLPQILALLREGGVGVADLDAIAFGRGPGAFTGLRTACAVAQGLAFGAGKPVVAVDSLLTVAEHARAGASTCRVWAAIDARMDEIYAAEYVHVDGAWTTAVAPALFDAAALNARFASAPPEVVAGNALVAFDLHTGGARRVADARPEARSLLAVADAAWRAGAAVDAALALPLYVRDKVALTTVERSTPSERKGRRPEGTR